ncbi:cell division topological specificity factor MinE [Sporomusa acidovorans]|uniref:Cell division topological specificity factor n=1 Tax=Sporomusa acidovorans (strain ATCC 49682 / DSM 3132 / Mol) TaxID=1123286 RepID=A0ABZ3J0Q4_SPOA4|nr:cell division topological specificity factor MinE [Sporomusa acidovorans]OZC22513.1 cell division topological specificity factor [Sporomusa acidovorans DSM 3132]SDE73188.1 cell division topological specificity factor MinE [Sporomusa acidovorans]
MFDLIQKLFGKEPQGSKNIAKERLRFVLVHDRVNVSPQYMEAIKDDMIKVISNYMDINETEMEINLTKSNTQVALVANIPVNRMKRTNLLNE